MVCGGGNIFLTVFGMMKQSVILKHSVVVFINDERDLQSIQAKMPKSINKVKYKSSE